MAEQQKKFQVKSITVGGFTIKNCTILLKVFPEEVKPDGILGRKFFYNNFNLFLLALNQYNKRKSKILNFNYSHIKDLLYYITKLKEIIDTIIMQKHYIMAQNAIVKTPFPFLKPEKIERFNNKYHVINGEIGRPTNDVIYLYELEYLFEKT